MIEYFVTTNGLQGSQHYLAENPDGAMHVACTSERYLRILKSNPRMSYQKALRIAEDELYMPDFKIVGCVAK